MPYKNFPDGFVASLEGAPGFSGESFIRVHASGEQVTSIRLNPFKRSLELPFTDTRPVPWCSDGLYLSVRPSFTLDPSFHAGAYYVQEASSMFLEQAFRQTLSGTEPIAVLDLCAAPGGKSTHLLSLLPPGSLLVSNELIRTRVQVLTENITKWGASNVIVTSNDPKDFSSLSSFFDVIVVDAPCSGSGLFRRDPDAMEEWSLPAVTLCSQRQQRILADVMDALKPGGTLIYSTCSYSVDEDEQISDWLMQEFGMESCQLATDPGWQIIESVSSKEKGYGYRFYPDRLEGEGFFLSAFKKPQPSGSLHSSAPKQKTSKQKVQMASDKEMQIASGWIKHLPEIACLSWNEKLLGFPVQWLSALHQLQQKLYIRKAGVVLGEVVRQDFIPDHELALSLLFSNQVPVIQVDSAQALQFLRRADMNVSSHIKGWALIRYKDWPLGWVKVLPNRINNYYPKDWRILNK